VTEDDEVLCGRCYRPNPGDEWLRRRERTAAASGTVEDTIRFANERKRRGGDVAPWELVPIAYTFLEAWKEIEPKVTLITPTSGSLNLDGGRVEAYRHAAFKPWLMGAPDKPERFYVTACSYPLLAYGEIPEHRGQDEELEGHVNAVESWRHAGAIVVRLDLGDVQALHDKHHFGTGPDPAGCSYCQRNREGAQRVLVQEDNARNALTTPKVWGGRPPRGVLFPAQWDWARLMKRRGGRWRNPRG
jgi:hypothetical protein